MFYLFLIFSMETTKENGTFCLDLRMAGAVSAGAYTALPAKRRKHTNPTINCSTVVIILIRDKLGSAEGKGY